MGSVYSILVSVFVANVYNSGFYQQAIRIYRSHSYFQPELARALYKFSVFYDHLEQSLGLMTGQTGDLTLRAEAIQLYNEVVCQRQCHQKQEPVEEDFDSLVRIWSR